MLEKSKTRQRDWHKQGVLREVGEDATGKQVLDFLFGDEYGRKSDYIVYKYTQDHRSVWNRFNLIWVFPIFCVVAPFQWIISGDIGVDRRSYIGRTMHKLINLDR
jgi:hypothetical protein